MDIAREICTDSFYTVNSGTPRIPVKAVEGRSQKPKQEIYSQADRKGCPLPPPFGQIMIVIVHDLKENLVQGVFFNWASPKGRPSPKSC